MSNVTSNTADPAWYDDLTDAEKGMVSGMSNAMFFGIILGGLAAVCAIGGLIYHCKRKKELERMVEEQELEKKRAANQVAPSGDIYDEMNGEIQRHEDQKKKLTKYLNFLLNKDAQGLASVNNKRLAAQKARQQQNNWFA